MKCGECNKNIMRTDLIIYKDGKAYHTSCLGFKNKHDALGERAVTSYNTIKTGVLNG